MLQFDIFILLSHPLLSRVKKHGKTIKDFFKNKILIKIIKIRKEMNKILLFNQEQKCFTFEGSKVIGIHTYIEKMKSDVNNTRLYNFNFTKKIFRIELKKCIQNNIDCDIMDNKKHGSLMDANIIEHLKNVNVEHVCFRKLLCYLRQKQLIIISSQNIIYDKNNKFATSIDFIAIRSFDSKLFIFELKSTTKNEVFENHSTLGYIKVNDQICVANNLLNKQLLQIHLIKKIIESYFDGANLSHNKSVEFVLLKIAKKKIVEYTLI